MSNNRNCQRLLKPFSRISCPISAVTSALVSRSSSPSPFVALDDKLGHLQPRKKMSVGLSQFSPANRFDRLLPLTVNPCYWQSIRPTSPRSATLHGINMAVDLRACLTAVPHSTTDSREDARANTLVCLARLLRDQYTGSPEPCRWFSMRCARQRHLLVAFSQ